MEKEFINNFKKIYLSHMESHLFLIEDEKDVEAVNKIKEVLEKTEFDTTNVSLFNTIIAKYNKIIAKI